MNGNLSVYLTSNIHEIAIYEFISSAHVAIKVYKVSDGLPCFLLEFSMFIRCWNNTIMGMRWKLTKFKSRMVVKTWRKGYCISVVSVYNFLHFTMPRVRLQYLIKSITSNEYHFSGYPCLLNYRDQSFLSRNVRENRLMTLYKSTGIYNEGRSRGVFQRRP